MQQVRQTIQASQDFDPAIDRRDFTIGSADYTSFVLLPKLLAHCQSVFEEHFVGIARKGHPAFQQTPISIEAFANLSHVLVTIRGDAKGAVDRLLAEHNLQRRVAVTTPHLLVVPSIVASSDLVATIASRAARYFCGIDAIELFELPIVMPSWTVSMMWSKLADRDAANLWLRQMVQDILAVLNPHSASWMGSLTIKNREWAINNIDDKIH